MRYFVYRAKGLFYIETGYNVKVKEIIPYSNVSMREYTDKDNDIYISISHAIADGRGAVLFGCSLIYEYLKLIGIKIGNYSKR